MQIITYKFTGLSPLLMCSTKSIGDADVPQIKLGTTPDAGDIDKVAEALTYRNDDGALCFPSEAFRSSLLYGCKGQKIKGSRSGPAGLIQGLFASAEEFATLADENGEPLTSFEIDKRTGVNKATKARIPLFRPMLREWHATVPFEFDDDFAPPNTSEFLKLVLELWNRAGRMAGVGAFRPEKKGWFGKYKVEMARSGA
jgi:hypothetical protein